MVATSPKRFTQNLQQTLKDMIAAYTKASTNYQETEAIINESLAKQRSTLG